LKRKWRAVAWDIDGTLIDSEPLHERALLAVCEDYIDNINEIDAESFIGIHMHDVWRILKPKFPAALNRRQWLNEIEAYYIAHIDQAAPMPGAQAIIRHLHRAGILQIFVSNSSRTIVDGNLARIGVRELGLPSISFNEVPHGKPDPAPYLAACKRLGVEPVQCLAVEDSLAGCRSAHSAGLFTIAFMHAKGLNDDVNDHHIQRLEELRCFF
jgi:HAD superfamily hydrolase (TIGR01509 family)